MDKKELPRGESIPADQFPWGASIPSDQFPWGASIPANGKTKSPHQKDQHQI